MQPLDVERSMYQIGLALTKAPLSQDKPPESLIRKLDVIVDGEIAKRQATSKPLDCKRGCDHCCHRVIPATIPEILHVADYVKAHFTRAERDALSKRLTEYVRAVAPSFGVDLQLARPTCPFLVDHECTAYEARPLECRAVNSYDVSLCVRAKDHPTEQVPLPILPDQRRIISGITSGLLEGLKRKELDTTWHDFGRGLKIALENPDATAEFLGNERTFKFAQLRGRDPEDRTPSVIEPVQPNYQPGQEPTGHANFTGLGPAIHLLTKKGDTRGAIASLKGKHPMYRLYRIQTPVAYGDEEEIGAWRKHFVEEVRAFAASDFDAREAFDALESFTTFNLAYQMNDVKGPLSELGQVICNQITAKALPSLVAPLEPKWRSGKLKVGYISYSLRGSNGAKWALGWLKNHGDDIETYAFNLNENEDRWSLRFKEEADHYHHLKGNVPADARMIRSLGLDVLIYTDLGMPCRNYQFASMRLAPVQCTAWGHPVTSGLPTIDHYLSSDLMESAQADAHYSENLVRLPNSGLHYDRPSTQPSTLSKVDYGLDDGPLYLMCQHLAKCEPKWDFLFRRINEESGRPIVFIQGHSHPADTEITRKRLEKAGVNMIWLPKMGRKDFLRLLSLAEVSIDPPAWNGGNTTIEALNLGVPVVTLPTEFMRGRHSLAFLKIAGAEALVAGDADDYVRLATDKSSRDRGMARLNADGLFNDMKPVEALDEFLRRASRP